MKRLVIVVAALLALGFVLIPSPGDVAGAALVEQPAECVDDATDAPAGPPVQVGSATQVTMAELASLTRAARFDEYGEQVLQTAVATFWHESARGQIKARNPTSGAAGLTQIMPANYRNLGGDPDVPAENLRMAKQLADERVKAGRDPLGPWVSYTNGAYEEFMDEAAVALKGGSVAPKPAYESAVAAPCGSTPAVLTAAGPPGAVGPITGSNGQLDTSKLCRVAIAPMADHMALLQCPAAKALDALAVAYEADRGERLCYGNGYRSLAQQVTLARTKPGLAAKAGTSNHGWGLAVDLCNGVNIFGHPAHQWMVKNAGQFGWIHPKWAQRSGSRPEPWHWEYGDTSAY